ncbi:integral membrane protein-like protein [Saccharata proteae CBS 121410]|uniref:Integral membrane protein-like protein n=1 Tax=Saccharata proteae CBS 121410 TaxID=1314787 RepID=A0A9P4M069_9PEZI|nr:integral membrane protein-like protein [Saccharata proteae CBS 121410]
MADKDAAAKQRVISHMNADHGDSITRFLEHYCRVSSFTARRARLADMSLASMQVEAGGKQYNIPLEPSMDSWRDARERMVKMDQDALAGLGRSDITIREYRVPKGFHAVVFTVCLLTYVLVSRRQNALPGSFIYDNVLRHVPALASFTAKVQPTVLALMVGIHLFEASVMARRLAKHNVPLLGGLWWAWTGSCFIEGFGALQRTSAIVAEEQAAKHKQQH